MKLTHQLAAAVVTSLALGAAVTTAYAHPGYMHRGMGPYMQGGPGQGMWGGPGQGMWGGGPRQGAWGGPGPGAMTRGGPGGPGAGFQLMTPEERAAHIDRMRNAKTPEERAQIADANHAEMQKRAKEKGITLPERRGPRFGAAPQAPATTE